MDQIAIGIFIAQKRKEQNLTQEQLAECIGVSNKNLFGFAVIFFRFKTKDEKLKNSIANFDGMWYTIKNTNSPEMRRKTSGLRS